MFGQHEPCGFLQAAAGTVADHGVADLLRHGKAKPRRTWSSRGSACSTRPGIGALRPLAAARRNSARRVRRPGRGPRKPRSGRQALAALGAAVGQHLAASDGRHAGAEPVPPLADQLRRLIGALHGRFSDGAWMPARARARTPTRRPSQAAAYRGAVKTRQSRHADVAIRQFNPHCHATATQSHYMVRAMRTLLPILAARPPARGYCRAWAGGATAEISWASLGRNQAALLGWVGVASGDGSDALLPALCRRASCCLCRKPPSSPPPAGFCSARLFGGILAVWDHRWARSRCSSPSATTSPTRSRTVVAGS